MSWASIVEHFYDSLNKPICYAVTSYWENYPVNSVALHKCKFADSITSSTLNPLLSLLPEHSRIGSCCPCSSGRRIPPPPWWIAPAALLAAGAAGQRSTTVSCTQRISYTTPHVSSFVLLKNYFASPKFVRHYNASQDLERVTVFWLANRRGYRNSLRVMRDYEKGKWYKKGKKRDFLLKLSF